MPGWRSRKSKGRGEETEEEEVPEAVLEEVVEGTAEEPEPEHQTQQCVGYLSFI